MSKNFFRGLALVLASLCVWQIALRGEPNEENALQVSDVMPHLEQEAAELRLIHGGDWQVELGGDHVVVWQVWLMPDEVIDARIQSGMMIRDEKERRNWAFGFACATSSDIIERTLRHTERLGRDVFHPEIDLKVELLFGDGPHLAINEQREPALVFPECFASYRGTRMVSFVMGEYSTHEDPSALYLQNSLEGISIATEFEVLEVSDDALRGRLKIRNTGNQRITFPAAYFAAVRVWVSGFQRYDLRKGGLPEKRSGWISLQPGEESSRFVSLKLPHPLARRRGVQIDICSADMLANFNFPMTAVGARVTIPPEGRGESVTVKKVEYPSS